MRLFPMLKPRFIRMPSWASAQGMSFYPFIFVKPNVPASTVAHELVHHEQQDRYWAVAGPLGLFAWYVLYLLALPVGWNPWRWRWEYEAFERGQDYHPTSIEARLRRGMYRLWWMGMTPRARAEKIRDWHVRKR